MSCLNALCYGLIPQAAVAGGDGGQVFGNQQYRSHIYGLHLQDLPPDLLAKNVAWAPVGCTDGPTEPGSQKYIQAETEQFFLDHDPGARPRHTN